MYVCFSSIGERPREIGCLVNLFAVNKIKKKDFNSQRSFGIKKILDLQFGFGFKIYVAMLFIVISLQKR